MPLKPRVRAAIDAVSTGGDVRCDEMVRLLRRLGFIVRDAKKQGHKTFSHPGLARFTSASFTCGHGRDPQVKRVYIHRIRKLLEDYGEELSEIDSNGNERR